MTKLILLNSLKELNYKELGFKSGIEIHQQLNTNKLFCNCPCKIVEDNNSLNKEIMRKLRFSLSEDGNVDSAAISEFKKGKYNIYKYNNEIACLVDLDEEPPKGPNKKALSVAIRISKMMNLVLFDKIQFMRKLIIDGSITSGYQRTAILGINGKIKTSFGEVKIEGINLEEDSCRTLERHSNYTIFALDRQGIPLIEITTAPDVKYPDEAFELAQQIGNILRSFPETKRGLGTIRQDLNVSIKGGSRVEIKGTQNLKLIPEIIKAEIRRQIIHLSIINELKEREINSKNFSDFKIYNLSKIFKNTKSEVISSNLKIKNSSVLGIKLNSFKGILGHELNNNYRFATEISNKNKAHFPIIKGLFHLDELPKYGITQDEVDLIRNEMGLNDNDSFILIANENEIAKKSLNYIFEIIKELISSVPEEVRQVDPKGTLTTPLRPMPGSARMYPETDIKDIELTQEILDKEFKNIPELYSSKLERLEKEFGLDRNKVEEILSKLNENEFKEILKISNSKPSQVYNLIFELPKEIKKREKIEPIEIEKGTLIGILEFLNKNKLNKNNLYKLFVKLYGDGINKIENINLFLKDNNLIIEEINEEEIESKIKKIIEDNQSAPFGALMGICMKEFKGNVEGKLISEIIKKNIN